MSKVMLISPKDNNFYNFRSELILKLKELGHEVILVCPYGTKIDFFVEHGCRFIDISVDRRGKNVFRDLHLLWSYDAILKKEKPDIVLTYTAKSSIYAGLACGCRKIPYIVNNAGLIETSGLFRYFLDFLYWVGCHKASCMMYQNENERDYLNAVLQNKVRYRDIPGSGVNLEVFSYVPYPGSDSEVIINYVARIVKIKGIEEFLRCVEIIKSRYSNVKFIVYGDYDDKEYKAKIQEMVDYGLLEYGGVKIDMKPCIANAHAVIHPSYYEGMTNVVLEHSAMGRVCLGSNIPGISEGIDDGRTGFLFEVKNVESMVAAVEKFLALSHEEKVSMGRNARRKMEQEFSREIVTNAYIEEINRILGER